LSFDAGCRCDERRKREREQLGELAFHGLTFRSCCDGRAQKIRVPGEKEIFSGG
jgi:hypothetical protein